MAIDRFGEKLDGCRSALEDYLAEHVAPEKQWAYLHTVICWIDDPAAAFKRPDGSTVADHREQASILAEAMNELAAGDESRMKWPAGDVKNLKTKISILVQQRTDSYRRPKSSTPEKAPRSHSKAGDRGDGFRYE